LRRDEPELLQLSTLVVWLGAAIFFSVAVAPALFAVLPSRALAGDVVGRLLPPIFYSGIIVGLLVMITQWRANDGWNWRGREAAAFVTVVACAVGQLFIAPRIERVRAEIPGPIEVLAADDPRRVAFGRLHGESVAWLGVAMLAALVAAVIAARAAAGSKRDFHSL
jgi:mannose/fructose/N-acetylgalactosamine-specific phosphotransferase system component IID